MAGQDTGQILKYFAGIIAFLLTHECVGQTLDFPKTSIDFQFYSSDIEGQLHYISAEPLEYIVVVELNASQAILIEQFRAALAFNVFPLQLDNSTEITAANITTVCQPNVTEYQCICEDGYAWTYNNCKTYEACDDIRLGSCGCISGIPSDGEMCVLDSELPFTDFLSEIEMESSSISVIDEMRRYLQNITFPLQLDELVEVLDVDITTVCHFNDSGYKCVCEDQYFWPCEKCTEYGSCDDITNNTCSCINDIPSDRQFCQPVNEITNSTACAQPTVTPVLIGYQTEVQIDAENTAIIDHLMNYFMSFDFPYTISDSTDITEINITTVCSLNETQYRCKCEGLFVWPNDTCHSYEACDDIIDGSCMCINALPIDGQFCQLKEVPTVTPATSTPATSIPLSTQSPTSTSIPLSSKSTTLSTQSPTSTSIPTLASTSTPASTLSPSPTSTLSPTLASTSSTPASTLSPSPTSTLSPTLASTSSTPSSSTPASTLSPSPTSTLSPTLASTSSTPSSSTPASTLSPTLASTSSTPSSSTPASTLSPTLASTPSSSTPASTLSPTLASTSTPSSSTLSPSPTSTLSPTLASTSSTPASTLSPSPTSTRSPTLASTSSTPSSSTPASTLSPSPTSTLSPTLASTSSTPASMLSPTLAPTSSTPSSSTPASTPASTLSPTLAPTSSTPSSSTPASTLSSTLASTSSTPSSSTPASTLSPTLAPTSSTQPSSTPASTLSPTLASTSSTPSSSTPASTLSPTLASTSSTPSSSTPASTLSPTSSTPSSSTPASTLSPTLASTSSTPASTLSPSPTSTLSPTLASTSSTPSSSTPASTLSPSPTSTLSPTLASTSSTPASTLSPSPTSTLSPTLASTSSTPSSSTPASTLSPSPTSTLSPTLASTSSTPASMLSPTLAPTSSTPSSSTPASTPASTLSPTLAPTSSTPSSSTPASTLSSTLASTSSTPSSSTPASTLSPTLAPTSSTQPSSTPASTLSPTLASTSSTPSSSTAASTLSPTLASTSSTPSSSTPASTLSPTSSTPSSSTPASTLSPTLASTSSTPASTLSPSPTSTLSPTLASTSSTPSPSTPAPTLSPSPTSTLSPTLASTSSTPASTLSPSPMTATVIGMSVTLNMSFETSLTRPNDENYKVLSGKIETAIKKSYSNKLTGYISGSTKVNRFRSGSIIADYTINATSNNLDFSAAHTDVSDSLRAQGIILAEDAFARSEQKDFTTDELYPLQKLELNCIQSDFAKGPITWMVNNKDPALDKKTYNISNNNSTLTVKNATESDSGRYLCIQNSTVPYIQWQNIVIKQRPTIIVGDNSRVISCEDPVQLRCSVDAGYSIEWVLNDTVQAPGSDSILLNYKSGNCKEETFTCRLKGLTQLQNFNYSWSRVTVKPGTEHYECKDEELGFGKANEKKNGICGNGMKGIITYRCKSPKWIPEQDNCVLNDINEIKSNVSSLTVEGIPGFMANLSSVTAVNSVIITQSAATVQAIVDILVIVAKLSQTTIIDEPEMVNFLKTVDIIVSGNVSDTWNKLNKGNTSTELLSAIEKISDRLKDDFPFNGISIQLNRTTIKNSVFSITSTLPNSSTEIIIPQVPNMTTITIIIFSTLDNVLPTRSTSNKHDTNNSKVRINGDVVVVKVNKIINNINFAFDTDQSLGNPQCVFWNFNLDAWDSTGCEVGEKAGKITCECNHTTSFSILMSPFSLDHKALAYITYIGVTISMASLVICLIIETIVWKSVRRNDTSYMRHVSIVNIAVSLLIANICFIIGAAVAEQEQPTSVGRCSPAVFFMHFFYLALFFWMFISALLLFYRTVMVLSQMSRSTMMAIAFIVGYGAPLLIAVITVASTAGPKHYVTKELACWLNLNESKALLAFVIPALTIVAINLVVLIVVLYKMLRRGVGATTQPDEKHALVVIARCLAILTPIFGLTWGFGIGTMVSRKVGIHVVFALLNSLQGLFILVFGLLLDRKVRESLQGKLLQKLSSSHTKNTSAGSSSTPRLNFLPWIRRRNVYNVSEANTSSAVTDSSNGSYAIINT